jgi:carbamoyl-phosphate synthase large subunit
VSLNDFDKRERSANIVKAYVRLGFNIIATVGTAKFLRQQGIESKTVLKASEGTLNIIDMINSGWVDLIINTPLGQTSRRDEHEIGRVAMERRIPFITTLSAAASAAKSIEQTRKSQLTVLSVQEYHKLAAQGGEGGNVETLEDCVRLVEDIKSFHM